jgi:hypothetical protein
VRGNKENAPGTNFKTTNSAKLNINVKHYSEEEKKTPPRNGTIATIASGF